MLHQGKATKEEWDAVLNFENALENLSDAMEKIGRIPELRKRLRHGLYIFLDKKLDIKHHCP